MGGKFDSWEAKEIVAAPVHFNAGDMVLVSLSAGSEASTCPAVTGERPRMPCTPVVQRSPLDALCNQLRKAITPILSQMPSREVAAPKRRLRQRRQPVSNPRRSIRIARGIGRGYSATKKQNVLIRKLCLANEGEVISDDALQAYVKLFE